MIKYEGKDNFWNNVINNEWMNECGADGEAAGEGRRLTEAEWRYVSVTLVILIQMLIPCTVEASLRWWHECHRTVEFYEFIIVPIRTHFHFESTQNRTLVTRKNDWRIQMVGGRGECDPAFFLWLRTKTSDWEMEKDVEWDSVLERKREKEIVSGREIENETWRMQKIIKILQKAKRKVNPGNLHSPHKLQSPWARH